MKKKTKKTNKTIDELMEECGLATPPDKKEDIEPVKPPSSNNGNLEDIMAQMTDEEMSNILFDFRGSLFWPAYKKYTLARLNFADDSLRTMDPFKQNTELARNQGIRFGLLDLEGYIVSLTEIRNKRENGE